MERVKKGEKYWFIYYSTGYGDNGISVEWDYETSQWIDNMKWAEGNYFHTKEDAESMARKLRAALNGADVIEWPSEEDKFDSIDRIYQQKGYAEGEYCHEQSFSWGFQEGVDWLKSKITK